MGQAADVAGPPGLVQAATGDRARSLQCVVQQRVQSLEVPARHGVVLAAGRERVAVGGEGDGTDLAGEGVADRARSHGVGHSPEDHRGRGVHAAVGAVDDGSGGGPGEEGLIEPLRG